MNAHPEELKYSETHEWVRIENEEYAVIGITEHAQEKLGEVVYVELPDKDVKVNSHDEVGLVESVKATVDIYTPLSGKIVEVNEDLLDAPGLINSDPYGDGWLYKIKIKDMDEYKQLLDADEYIDTIDMVEDDDEDGM